MEGPATWATAQKSEAAPTERWRDARLLVVLLILAIALRAWLIMHTEVAARDSIGFIRTTLQLQNLPLEQALHNSLQHPGYPATLLAISLPVRHFLGGTTPFSMQFSAQLASALAGVLLVVPMFYLGRALFDRGVGFWAAALFQCLPVSARIMADGLSDATYLLLAAATLLAAVHALRRGTALHFALCGAGVGLAYLTRPEGGLLGVATALVLLGSQAIPAWRWPWRKTLLCGGTLALATAVLAVPYAAAIGSVTPKTSPRRVLGDEGYKLDEDETTPLQDQQSQGTPPLPVRSASAHSPLLASTLAAWDFDYGKKVQSNRELWALQALGSELLKGFQYLALLPAVLGLWWFRDRFRAGPAAWVLVVACGLQLLVLYRMAVLMGYVSERHVLIVVLCGSFWAMAAVREVGQRLAAWFGRRTLQPPVGRARRLLVDGRFWSGALLIFVTAWGVPSSLKPLHANRAGHHAAGLWLAAHAHPGDELEDPYCWAHYYAGGVFREGTEPVIPPGSIKVHYVVLESSHNPHSRLTGLENARNNAKKGTLVYRWSPPSGSRDKAEEVVVYAVPMPAGPGR